MCDYRLDESVKEVNPILIVKVHWGSEHRTICKEKHKQSQIGKTAGNMAHRVYNNSPQSKDTSYKLTHKLRSKQGTHGNSLMWKHQCGKQGQSQDE